jgi:hypothetical protein
MPIKALDALALASMDTPAQLPRIAAIWCRAHNDRPPYNRVEILKWVKQEFGPLLDEERAERISKELLEEVKRQIRCRRRRAQRKLLVDPCDTPAGSNIRLGRLLQSRLGPARRWVSQSRMLQPDADCAYIDGDFYSGLVAGLIPVQMRLRRISNPNLLVYRHRWAEPRTRFVASHITSVADAFIWLIPPEAAEFLQLPGTRVEHDGEAQTVRLITQFGTKALPWRQVASPLTG